MSRKDLCRTPVRCSASAKRSIAQGAIIRRAHQAGLEMMVPYEDLQKKLKLDEERRWLNPDELEDIIRLTSDPRLLAALVRPAGAVWYRPEAVNATASALKAVGDLLQREGEFVATLHKGADDNRWEPDEVADLEYHGANVIRAVLGIMAGARQAMEQDLEDRANG